MLCYSRGAQIEFEIQKSKDQDINIKNDWWLIDAIRIYLKGLSSVSGLRYVIMFTTTHNGTWAKLNNVFITDICKHTSVQKCDSIL